MIDLSGIAAIDQHAHNLVRSDVAAATPYVCAFTEGYDPEVVHHHARSTLFYRRSLRDIAQLLDCHPTEAAILDRRSQLGLEALTRCCFEAANLQAVYLDDGFLPDTILPWEWHQQFTSIQRLLRIEWLAEQLMNQVDRFEIFLEWFRSELNPPPKGVVGLKSIAAYRSGLDIQSIPLDLAADRFYALKEQYPEQIRLSDKALIDFLLHEALAIAAQYHLPVQFHSGFGDPDLDLRLANPLHLRPLLENPHYRQVPIVLLHASYPYTQEAGYLASVYPHVYVDTGLAVPFLSVIGMKRCLEMLLELSPTSKIVYSSDAHLIPELYYLGAKWGRAGLSQVLEDAIQSGDLSAQEAEEAAIDILWRNAQRLYQPFL
ncbi:amidohydrolase family protein [Thermocoleostomius sinensis]|uniref:Amidohydrolase family protein n=1 Tax=Thermocoleostomius sinensis A174 TaxID=2016057 RepID=A0A9E8ZBI7_9CYAN|nr:amidohydrolase family protein [Thermocoleostomius sinensis]WAL58230.1 amidohydrolase family protein [Thermocoleostomius sinensis A174]